MRYTNDIKKNWKPPAMTEPRKPKKLAKKPQPVKDSCPPSLPAKLTKIESLHKPSDRHEDYTPRNHTQSNSELRQILRKRPKMEAKPQANRRGQVLRPGMRHTPETKIVHNKHIASPGA